MVSSVTTEGNANAYDHKQVGISKNIIDEMLEI